MATYDPTTSNLGTVTPMTDAWQTNPDWVGQQHVSPPSDLDRRIADLGGIYGDYSSALQGAQIDFDPYRQAYNQYYGQPSSGISFGPGGGWSAQSATGQYLPIQQALQGAQSYYGDQQERYNEFYGDQQGRYGNLASQFLDMAQGTLDAEGNRTGGFYNTQYANALAFLDAQRVNSLSGADAQYANTLSGANTVYDLGMGAVGADGTRTGGFFANQYAGATGDALGMRNRLTGDIDPTTGMATGGLYGTQYDYDTSFASSIYDLAGGVLDDTGARMGGFYQDQAASAVSAANAAYNSAAAPLETTTETRPVMDEFDQPVMEEVTTWEPMHEADGTPILDANGTPVTEPVVSMQPTTEEIVSYQGGFYSVQEANQIRRAQMAETQARQQAARVHAQQVQTATRLYDNAKQFFSNEKDAALGMLAAMEGVQTAPDATPEEIAAATAQGGARGRYTQQMSFFGEQEQRGIAELARQIGVVNAENLRRSGRVETYEDLMVGEVDPLTGERPRYGGRIGEQEQALLERIGGLQSTATAEMATVQASEEQRLADLRSGYGTEVSEAVAALQAQGIDPTQLQGMTAQTGALLGAQEASQLAMLERLQRAQTMLGSEQTLAATSMAGDARLALENQLFSTRAGIEEDIYGRLEGVEQQKYGVAEGARGGQFQAGQTLSGMLDELGREAYGYGSQARSGEFGARQTMEGSLGAAAIGQSERVFDAGQRRASTVGAAGDMARAGVFQSGQQQASAVAQANAMRDAGLFTSENAYNMAMMQAQSNLLSGTTQAQMAYEQALANARDAQALGGYQSGVNWQGTMTPAYGQQQAAYTDIYGQQLAGYADAYGQQETGYFNAANQYYQSMFDAMEQSQAGQFNAAEAAGMGVFNAQQTADAQGRATQTDQFNQMMQLAMQESAQGAGLQGDLAQADLTRDLAINAATQQSESDIQRAEAATAAGVASMQAWFAPGSSTAQALYGMGYTPESVAGFDNTTLRAIVTDYNDEVRYQGQNVQTLLPWDQSTLYNEATGAWGSMSDYPGLAPMRTGQSTSSQAISPWEQAQTAGFSPWQDPITYTNAQYASGDYPSTYGYQEPAQPWIGNSGQGVGFDLGRYDQQGFVLESLPALKAYGNLQHLPYPSETDISNDPSVVQTWYADVFEKLTGQAAPTVTVP